VCIVARSVAVAQHSPLLRHSYWRMSQPGTSLLTRLTSVNGMFRTDTTHVCKLSSPLTSVNGLSMGYDQEYSFTHLSKKPKQPMPAVH
jgi:hypothetical protein